MDSHTSSSLGKASPGKFPPKSHANTHQRHRNRAGEDMNHNEHQHPDNGPSRNDTQSRPRTLTELSEIISSQHDSSKNHDRIQPFSESELASVIQEFGRGRGLSTRLCRTCRPIVGWFFLDHPTWIRATAGSSFIFIRAVDHNNLDDMCLLCDFLGKLAERLRASGLPEGDQGYRLRATTINRAFKHSRITTAHDDAPLFCLAPSGPSFLVEDIMKYNHFAPDPCHHRFENVRVRRIKPYTDPALVRQWIAFCDMKHQRLDCHSPNADSSIPFFSVIDCSASPPCLVSLDPRNSLGYITLSYVWGHDPCEVSDEHGRLPRRLPELIRGAIWVTLTLGYRYLWIDRYCIPQDDPIRKRSLVENMGKIYEDSMLCIVAAAAKSPKDGLHGVTRPRGKHQQTLNIGSLSLSQLMTNIKEEIRGSTWNSRGWTYQEGILSKRRLVFTETQCCFQCGEQCFLESLEYPMRSDFDFSHIPHPFPTQSGRNSWLQEFDIRAQEYSRRQLSKESDAVPAFTGILKHFHSLIHVCGVPVFDPAYLKMDADGAFLGGLAWFFVIDNTVMPSSSQAALPRRRSGVPSWTWCAWECGSTPYRPSWKLLGGSCSRVDFLATTIISVEDTQGNITPWSDYVIDAMDQKLPTLRDVKFLRVRGWVCNVAIPDTSVYCPPQDISHKHGSSSYFTFEGDLPRLNALARKRHMRSVGGSFIFPGWVVSIVYTGGFEMGQCLLLSGPPDGKTVERLDMCLIRFQTLPEMSLDKINLPQIGWTLQYFRIS